MLGFNLIKDADRPLKSDHRLTWPGKLAGIIVVVAIIISNPKAILFYIGILPGFLDLSELNPLDAIVIC